MPSVDEEMIAVFEASGLLVDDERPEAAARALDETWPYRVHYEVGEPSEGAPLISHQHDRERWLRSSAMRGRIPLVTTSADEPTIAFSAHAYVGENSPYNRPIIRALLEFPETEEFVAKTALVVERVGRALNAYWGKATPKPAGILLAKQRVHPGQKRVPPLGLPKLPGGIKLASTAVPHELGWINYWPAAAAALLGFPDGDRDAEWRRRATALDDGGWIVRLTDDPLDLDRPDHLDAVKRAYERFAEIGRSAAN